MYPIAVTDYDDSACTILCILRDCIKEKLPYYITFATTPRFARLAIILFSTIDRQLVYICRCHVVIHSLMDLICSSKVKVH